MIFRTLLTQVSSLFISLFIAVFVWAVATNEENPARDGVFQDPIPIQFTNQAAGLQLVDKSADAVKVRIRAPVGSWDKLRSDKFQADVDLRSLPAGTQTSLVSVTTSDPQVSIVAVEPATVTVKLEGIKRATFDVRVHVLDDPPIGYEFKNITENLTRVTVSGPESLVDQVNEATAEIALRGTKITVDREVPIVLHDSEGNIIQNLTPSPATVSIHVDVVQRVGYKEVAVKAVVHGSVASGFWVSDIRVDPPTVTLIGAAEALDKLPGFVEGQAVNVEGARADVTKQVGLNLPQGITAFDLSNVNVRVSVEPLLGGITIHRKVTVSELRCELPVTVSPDSVDVILSGPLPILQSVTSDAVQINVEVNGCTPSIYQALPQAVKVPDLVKVESIVPNTIQVIVKGR